MKKYYYLRSILHCWAHFDFCLCICAFPVHKYNYQNQHQEMHWSNLFSPDADSDTYRASDDSE